MTGLLLAHAGLPHVPDDAMACLSAVSSRLRAFHYPRRDASGISAGGLKSQMSDE